MTEGQLEKANELRRQILRLERLLADFEKIDIDDSPSRDTSFYIKKVFDEGYIHRIENYELGIFISAIKDKISDLEREFKML